ncbi:MAG TPA: hypothetical protein VF981_05335 [Gemmatimonadaceae bacterium]
MQKTLSWKCDRTLNKDTVLLQLDWLLDGLQLATVGRSTLVGYVATGTIVLWANGSDTAPVS